MACCFSLYCGFPYAIIQDVELRKYPSRDNRRLTARYHRAVSEVYPADRKVCRRSIPFVERRCRLKKLAKFIPVLIAIAGILMLTMQNKTGTMALSNGTRKYLVEILGLLGVDAQSEWWNTSASIRWIGHFIEYFILGLVSGAAFKKKRYALILCAAISLLDQVTKIFVPVRHFDPEDIPFDVIGFCSGIAITWIVGMAINKLRDIDTE